jgi:hypothetical protein
LHYRIDAFLDQPGERNPGQIGADQRERAEDQLAPVTVDEKLNTKIVAINGVTFVYRINLSD